MMKHIIKFFKKAVYTALFVISLSSNSYAKKIVFYLDPASLPTLHMLMHLVKNSDDKDTTRVLAMKSFFDPDYLKKQFHNIHLLECADKFCSQKEMKQILETELSKLSNGEKLEVELHSNLHQAYGLTNSIISTLAKNKNKMQIKSIDLYSDGSAEYVELYNLKNKNVDLKQDIKESEIALKKYLVTGRTSLSISATSGYIFHKFFPTKYHLLIPQYLDDPYFKPLKDYLGNRASGFDYNQINQLSQEKKKMYFRLVGLTPKIRELFANNQPKFILTGTTFNQPDLLKFAKLDKVFGSTTNYFCNQHLNILENFINPKGALYLGDKTKYKIYFKGHPRGNEINECILDRAKNITNIPAKVSFEVLQMAGLLTDKDKVGGIASSLYFNLSPSMITDIVFKDEARAEYIPVMQSVGLVKQSQMYNWEDLPKLIDFTVK